MLRQTTFADMFSAISSPASASGPSRSDTPAGPTTGPCGPEAVPASRSRRRGSTKGKRTSGTCGPISFDLSTGAGRLASSASKSLPLSGTVGSMIYAMTWRASVTPRGRLIYRLVASARRPSASDCGGEQAGYPTPKAQEDNRTLEQYQNANDKIGKKAVTSLQVLVRSGYPTATVNDATGSQYAYSQGNHETRVLKLPGVAQVAGYPATQARDGKGAYKNHTKAGNDLSNVAQLAGYPSCKATDGDKGARTRRGAALELERKGLGSDLPTIAAAIETGGGNRSGLVLADGPELEGHAGHGDDGDESGRDKERENRHAAATSRFGADACDWLDFLDGKTRPIEPGLECLVDGAPFRLADGRTGRATQSRAKILKGIGDAIVPEVAAAFIQAYYEVTS